MICKAVAIIKLHKSCHIHYAKLCIPSCYVSVLWPYLHIYFDNDMLLSIIWISYLFDWYYWMFPAIQNWYWHFFWFVCPYQGHCWFLISRGHQWFWNNPLCGWMRVVCSNDFLFLILFCIVFFSGTSHKQGWVSSWKIHFPHPLQPCRGSNRSTKNINTIMKRFPRVKLIEDWYMFNFKWCWCERFCDANFNQLFWIALFKIPHWNNGPVFF